ncbi:hypothetical protein J6590_016671 [Homalodisca vitripennis]|nr:hypothetical protein J6590_016671 [Homalodisca vitripennis]
MKVAGYVDRMKAPGGVPRRDMGSDTSGDQTQGGSPLTRRGEAVALLHTVLAPTYTEAIELVHTRNGQERTSRTKIVDEI